MKILLSFLVTVFSTVCVFLPGHQVIAQSPDKMNYQAVVRNSGGSLVSSQVIGMKVSILQGSPTGTLVYQEIYNPNPQTNVNGLVTIEIGDGIPQTGTFSTIDWSAGPYFIKTETDPTGGTNYTISGTSQLLSVPYALHAKTVASYTESDPVFIASPSNGITALNITDWSTAHGWGNHALVGYATYPEQTGNNGKVLTTDGISPSWVTPITSSDLMLKVSKAGDNMTGQLTINNLTDRTALVLNSSSHTELRIKGGSSYIPTIFIGTSASSPNAEDAIIQFNDINYGSSSRLAFHMAPAYNVLNLLSNGNVGIGNSAPSTTLDVNGIITSIGGNSTNWNSAFGWGNHAGLYRPALWVPDWTDVNGKPAFATVATSGIYDDLTNKPSNATITTDGFMSSDDKTKLDGLENVSITAGTGISVTGTYPNVSISSNQTHYLGEEYLDGIIFYLYTGSDGQQHGLVVSKTESTGIWSGSTLVGADRTEDGTYNTNLMPAESTAKTWVTGLGEGWYLPSIDELSLLWHNRFHVNKTARAIGSTLLPTNAYYWSSTEGNGAANAFAFHFDLGYTSYYIKTSTYRVRAVRAF